MCGSVFLGGSAVIFGLSVSLPSSYTIWCAPGTLHGSSTHQNVLVHAVKWSHSSSSSHTSVLSHTPTCTQTLTWAQSCTCCLLCLCPLTSFTLPSPMCSLPLALHELIHLRLSPGFEWSDPLGAWLPLVRRCWWWGQVLAGEVLQRAQDLLGAGQRSCLFINRCWIHPTHHPSLAIHLEASCKLFTFSLLILEVLKTYRKMLILVFSLARCLLWWLRALSDCWVSADITSNCCLSLMAPQWGSSGSVRLFNIFLSLFFSFFIFFSFVFVLFCLIKETFHPKKNFREENAVSLRAEVEVQVFRSKVDEPLEQTMKASGSHLLWWFSGSSESSQASSSSKVPLVHVYRGW